MINIEKVEVTSNLLKNIPKEILSKLSINLMIQGNEKGIIDLVALYGNRFEEVNKFVQDLQGQLEDLGYGFGIISIPIEKITDLARNPQIQYLELPKSLFLTDSISNAAICVDRTQNEFGIKGKGTIVGFIDSGIDFTHPAFRNDDGTTRIEYIYDISSASNVYNKEQINQALKSNDPYSVVPVTDLTEHGTHVAGIACAGGKIDKRYYGVAPESSIIMVKSGRGLFSLSTQVMRGIKFLIDKSNELGMPLVINMSLSTNDGAHNGTSLLEQYISTIATLERVTIVIAAGNEGDAAHHVGGLLLKENIIRFNVAEDETAVIINFYKSVLPDILLEIIAPTGVSTGTFKIEEGYKEGVISQNRYQIYDTGPKPFDIVGEVGISLISSGNYILPGQWTIKFVVTNDYIGNFDMWLPISEGLNKNTRFLEPTVYNTLGIPATVNNIISVGSYNNRTSTVSSFSGRGKLLQVSEVKPDIVAPGENIYSTAPDKGFDSKTGTSMATPHVSGIAALMMQWGIVNGNDSYLFGERLKYYLIMGAKRERFDVIYPNSSWGYGEVCIYNSIKSLVQDLNIISTKGPEYREMCGYEEYKIGDLFVRKPITERLAKS